MSKQFQLREFDAERLDSAAEEYRECIKRGDLKEAEDYLHILIEWDVALAKKGEQ